MIKKLSKRRENRLRMVRNLATSLILNERIITSRAKASTLKPYIIQLLRLSRDNTLNNRRRASSFLFTPKSTNKLFEDISERLINQNNSLNIQSYYLKNRIGDNSTRVLMSLNLKPLEQVIKDIKPNESKKSDNKTSDKKGVKFLVKRLRTKPNKDDKE